MITGAARMWKGQIVTLMIQFGKFVFLELRYDSGIERYGNGKSYLHGEDGLQHLTVYTSSFGVQNSTLCLVNFLAR
jgi:hypothetical protein